MANQEVADFDELFDDCYPDGDDKRESFSNEIEALALEGLLRTLTEGDRVLYHARPGLDWDAISHLACPIKKKILCYLIEDPKSFFILFNTQKGKLGLICKEIGRWLTRPERVVGFLFLDNNKDLAEQSLQAMCDRLAAAGFKPFLLSSASKDTVENIKYYIDAYEFNPDYKIPVILALANPKQATKVVGFMRGIHEKVASGSKLRNGVIFDEADAIYPELRAILKPYLVDDTTALHRLGWISATEGSLLDEEFPECANAHQQQEVIDPVDEANYRAFHLPGAKQHDMEIDRRDSNNVTAMKLLIDNAAHFKRDIILRDGSIYKPKMIVNSDGRNDHMEAFAYQCVAQDIYSVTYNQTGIKVYKRRAPYAPVLYKTKGKRFNELLFYIFEKQGLWDKPCVIIGRRKIDRGLGFHYVPRLGALPKIIDGKDGPLQTDGIKGLVWTDLILGRIDNRARAAQKSGRGAGIIGHSPQWPGEIHYWMHKETARIVRTHNETVDQVNEIVGSSTALQAKVRATAIVRAAQPAPNNHEVDPNTFRVFRTEAATRGFCQTMGYAFSRPQERSKTPAGFFQTSLNRARAVVSLLDAIKKVPTQYGGAAAAGDAARAWRTYIPCYKSLADNTSLRFVVIVRWKEDKTPEDPDRLAQADAAFPSIPVPLTGPLDAV